MQSDYSQKGILTPTIPYVITRSDFEKLYPVYQKMALSLVQTGKVRIVNDIQPSTVSIARAPVTESVPITEGYHIGGHQAASDPQSESAKVPADVRPICPSGHGVSTSSRNLNCGECVANVGCRLGTRSHAAGEAAPLGSYNVSHMERQEPTLKIC
jgi:hypothetical protein